MDAVSQRMHRVTRPGRKGITRRFDGRKNFPSCGHCPIICRRSGYPSASAITNHRLWGNYMRYLKTLSYAITVWTLFFVNIAAAQPANFKPNGCGSGWNVYLVPDSIPLLSCNFANSCNDHDACYSKCINSTEGDCEYRKCRKGGELYGNAICFSENKFNILEGKAINRRQACDDNFYTSMRQANKGKWACEALAIVYQKAVKDFGLDAFIGMGGFLNITALQQPESEYNKAIADFFTNSSERDFQEFVKNYDAGKPSVNLCGKLKFSENEGLTNVDSEDQDACKK